MGLTQPLNKRPVNPKITIESLLLVCGIAVSISLKFVAIELLGRRLGCSLELGCGWVVISTNEDYHNSI